MPIPARPSRGHRPRSWLLATAAAVSVPAALAAAVALVSTQVASEPPTPVPLAQHLWERR